MLINTNECSACIEMLFTGSTSDLAERIRLAAAAGYRAIEFWHWTNKDLTAIKSALGETGMTVAGFVAEPMLSLNDPVNHAEFLAALPASIATAQAMRAPFLYVQGGSTRPGVSEDDQSAALVAVLTSAADILHSTGVTLLLEPVSDAKDGFLTHAAKGLPIIKAVNRPEIRLLYDLFHAAVAGEDLALTIGSDIALIGHFHVADFPGRGAPGTGSLPLDQITSWLRAQGYCGLFGMEHHP